MQLTKDHKVYRSSTGEEFVIGRLSDSLLFSQDGRLFFEFIRGSGHYSSNGEFEFSFEDKHHGVSGCIKGDNSLLACSGVGYRRVHDFTSEIFVVPSPDHRYVEYLFTDEYGTYFYVDRPTDNWSYSSFRLFVGDGVTMREIPIENVSRYRDGGTTFITTAEGVLFSPTGFAKDRTPTWCDRPLTEHDPRDFTFTHAFSGNSQIFGGVTFKKN